MLNSLTLRISKWYKWLRFKDIVQEFEKLKKKIEWNRMECRIRKVEKKKMVEWNGIGWGK